ncbi:unnamed protein product [Vitrella brassicaformis CCMP3155]|uniref:Uncharacterized protein n=1 Tax=Vitrella brassicaformis (strain CCMP3155) TaxID=1169540 RepID=A0A0G4FBG7_VITBC|nr:unnamed protein product [Vitrella brassicaformis CCMP3155]|eukprot:CEM09971.1 unnamed protein product [Vitrella brassicaformis CCMP3155]
MLLTPWRRRKDLARSEAPSPDISRQPSSGSGSWTALSESVPHAASQSTVASRMAAGRGRGRREGDRHMHVCARPGNVLEAAKRGEAEWVAALIEAGADTNQLDNSGWTPLMWACVRRHINVGFLLIRAGAHLAHRADSGWTALHTAAYSGSLELIRLLVTSGASVHATEKRRRTPLHLAASSGQGNAVRQLVRFGARPHARDDNGWTPLHLAVHRQRVDAATALLDSGADANAVTNHQLTALHTAASLENDELVDLLLAHGARIDVNNADLKTPVDTAGNLTLRRRLITAGRYQRREVLFWVMAKGDPSHPLVAFMADNAQWLRQRVAAFL